MRAASHKPRFWTVRLLDDAERAQALLERWEARCSRGDPPTAPSQAELELLTSLYSRASDILNRLNGPIEHRSLHSLSFADLESELGALLDDDQTPYRIVTQLEIEAELERLGMGKLLAEIRERKPPAIHWENCFRHAWTQSCLDAALVEEPDLVSFDRKTHSKFVKEFCRLDEERLRLAAHRLRKAYARHAVAEMDKYPDQSGIVRREAAKRARHIPVRKLLQQAPQVMTAVCPCWVASPLSVSHLIDASQRHFDVVIFDEASQVLPEDAVPAIMRGRQVVVAGDSHQLPPTTFFVAGEQDEEEDADGVEAQVTGFESLLDIMSSFLPSWMLEWHYRSHDERLIAFSNQHIYGGRLVTFPGSGGDAPITHEAVEQDVLTDTQEESPGNEVRRVVDLVLDHARQRPNETLGVITMGLKHARRVEAQLDQAVQKHPELFDFLREDRDERFFVKNLERVQGDERDAIILSVGYGKDRWGKLPHRFGPLNYEGGERRLNVAITRARERMTLVSSFDEGDMDPAKTRARGAELLRLYLGYAASGGAILGRSGSDAPSMNAFELDVHEALSSRGLRLLPQYGVGRFRIDFAVQHPEYPGCFILAIECDGAAYHSAYTARERDRLRQQHLESLGWRFCRIWSTDWFGNRQAEIERVLASYDCALKRVGKGEDCCDLGKSTDESLEIPRIIPALTKLPVSEHCRQEPRPYIVHESNVADHTMETLVRLVRWLESDGRNRTRNELIEELVRELGYKRRGRRIIARLEQAISRARESS